MQQSQPRNGAFYCEGRVSPTQTPPRVEMGRAAQLVLPLPMLTAIALHRASTGVCIKAGCEMAPSAVNMLIVHKTHSMLSARRGPATNTL